MCTVILNISKKLQPKPNPLINLENDGIHVFKSFTNVYYTIYIYVGNASQIHLLDVFLSDIIKNPTCNLNLKK